ncbi:hypothetical protein A7U60_g1040 [Sanghuangporus baumii]|uniref:Uncharacterized protein n=1 Tax=Sanghuangporus baumii TaxID=108892 RepID=A0A9Q5I4N6_SANBA|nr:hypothetical protein A7U60_g1040 [Sanghuangporus baumii]
MSRRRSLPASNDNRDNTPRHVIDKTLARNAPSQFKSLHGNSPPRVFIKPKSGSSQTRTGSNDKLARRASLIAVPTNQQCNNRRVSFTLSKPMHAPRRSTSLHHTAINSMNIPASKLPRSSTLMRHASAGPVANRGVDADVGHFIQSSVCNRKDRTAPTKATSASAPLSPKNKENDPSTQLSSERTSGKHTQPRPKRTFTRRQSPLVPDELRQDESPPRKVFLLPKVDENVPKPPVPRRSSLRPAPPQLKSDTTPKKQTNIPSLPTIIMKHTPTKVTSAQHLFDVEIMKMSTGSSGSGIRQVDTIELAPKRKSKPRPFLLPPTSAALASLTSLSSILSLPSQVLKHTPLGAQSSSSPSSSPCLSKARMKTIWTMLDEMKLIRSGGLLSDADALAPESGVCVVPLCKRLRNGINESGSPVDAVLRRTPARSSSTPYHLVASSARRSRLETPSVVPPVPSISYALAHARAEWRNHPAEDPLRKTNDGEKYNWTLVDVKKPQRLRRRSTLGKPMISAGYGVSITTRDTMTARKPSLLTRAQTMVKLKFSGSKRVVGRGDPMWT